MTEEQRTILTEARARIAEGWIQGRAWSADGKCGCAWAWLRWAARQENHDYARSKYGVTELERILLPWEDEPDLVRFNEAAGRTKEQVLELFDRALEG